MQGCVSINVLLVQMKQYRIPRHTNGISQLFVCFRPPLMLTVAVGRFVKKSGLRLSRGYALPFFGEHTIPLSRHTHPARSYTAPTMPKGDPFFFHRSYHCTVWTFLLRVFTAEVYYHGRYPRYYRGTLKAVSWFSSARRGPRWMHRPLSLSHPLAVRCTWHSFSLQNRLS